MTTSNGDGTRDDRIPFLITIDAELDDGWSAPASPTTDNAVYLPRFQELCERYGLKPTYLTNYEMAVDPRYVEFGKDVLARDVGEIGMHLHAWNSPPTDHQLTSRDHAYVPYLIEYPTPVMRDKVAFLTDLLAETFESQPTSHRAGRWAMDVRYFKLLAEFGYRTDCSVTPFITWASYSGTPSGPRGTDYRSFPSVPYRLDPEQPSRPNPDGPLLEVPMTVLAPLRSMTRRLPAASFRSVFFTRAYSKVLPSRWLRPDGSNLQSMLSIVESVGRRAGGRRADGGRQLPHLEFMIHSSELMPGGSPRFRTPESIERLYQDLETLFESVSRHCVGMTVAEFADSFDQKAVFS